MENETTQPLATDYVPLRITDFAHRAASIADPPAGADVRHRAASLSTADERDDFHFVAVAEDGRMAPSAGHEIAIYLDGDRLIGEADEGEQIGHRATERNRGRLAVDAQMRMRTARTCDGRFHIADRAVVFGLLRGARHANLPSVNFPVQFSVGYLSSAAAAAPLLGPPAPTLTVPSFTNWPFTGRAVLTAPRSQGTA
jgi:hypothetical protein